MARRRLSKPVQWLLSLLGVVVLLVVSMSVVGAFQPAEHEASGSVVIAKPIGEVWAVLTDVKSHPQWRQDIKRVAPSPSADGREHWFECDEHDGCMELVTTELEAPRKWVRQIPPGGPFHGSWTHLLEEVPGGTKVTIVEKGVVPNPFFRFVSTFMLGHTYSLQQFLAQLAARMTGESHGR